MQLVLLISFVSFFCIKYVSAVTTQSWKNDAIRETDTVQEVNVMKDNYHELLKRVINNKNEIEDLKSREEHLKHELENVKKYITCQMEDIKDFTEEKYDNLNETKAALMKTMISFTQSLKLLNETMQELSHRQPEKRKCEENQTECNCTVIESFHETITSPGYPLEYSNHLAKNWSIDVGSGYRVKLQFTNFTTESIHDIVKVYDAAHAYTAKLRGAFSGYHIPLDMISTGRYMFVTFTTDRSVVKTGFSANVYKITSYSKL